MSLRAWWQAVQPHSFPASIVPVLLGATIAWTFFEAPVRLGTVLLTLAGVVAIHAATNMSNDYVDYRRGVDDVPRELITPFTGGSRVLPDGLVEPARHRQVFLALYAVGAVIGLYLAFTIPSGWVILLIGWIFGPLSLLYTYPPLALQYRGVGEILVGVVFGPVLVFGAFYVQASALAWEPVLASIPLGLLVAAFLLVNEMPERESDPRGGKRTVPARVGLAPSVRLFAALLAIAFLWLVLAVALGLLPPLALLGLLAAPLAWRAVSHLRRTEGRYPEHIPANALTVQASLLLGLLLIVAYVVPRFVPLV